MDMLNNIFTPQGHESAMKQALYNTLAFVFVLVFAVAGVALYFILEPFLQPLLWALLFGSVLYPFKHSLSEVLREWLQNVQAPLAIAVATSPVTVLDSISHSLITMIRKYLKLLLAVAGVMCVLYFLPLAWFMRVINVIHVLCGLVAKLLGFLSSAYTMWTMITAYMVLLLFNFNEQVAPAFRILSPIMYLSIFCFATSIVGALRIPLVLCIISLILIGFFAEIEDRGKCGPKTSERAATKVYDRMSIVEITVARKMKLWWIRMRDCLRTPEPVPEPPDDEEPLDAADGTIRPPPLIQVDDVDRSDDAESNDDPTEENTQSRESDLYLIAVMWACVVVQIYRNIWFLPLFYIPLLYSGMKYVWLQLNVSERMASFRDRLDEWYETRREAIVPDFLRPVVRLLLKGDRKIKQILENSVDSITAILVIILLFLVATVGTIFMAVQVYGESVHLIELTSGVINRTVVNNPELQQLVPDTISNVQGALDSMIGDAYKYGKDWIRGSLRRLLDDKDPTKAEALELELVELWDRVYQMWMQKNSTNIDGSTKELASPSWNTLLEGLKSLDVSAITSFVKDNLDTLQTVIDSLWVILKGNVTIVISVFTAVLSVVFGGGTAVLNFVINFVIFTTALFYLLVASDSTYKPIQLLSKAIPNSKGKPISGLGKAVEQAINGVFALSFKMAFFYGLYTWLIHSLFNVNIIYIPSFLAAIFGAVPFLGTYWACLPACLELWLVNGNPAKAMLMFFVQFLPMLFVDTAIYSEIKGGGHPYLTGLAIAGGVFCMGVQGALFGPMLLCVLIAACNVYSKLVQKSNQTSAANVNADGTPFSRAGSPKPRMKKRASFSGQLVTEKFN